MWLFWAALEPHSIWCYRPRASRLSGEVDTVIVVVAVGEAAAEGEAAEGGEETHL